MKVLVIGGRGNMGRKYRAILEYLGQVSEAYDWQEVEVYPKDFFMGYKSEFDAFIITTPTKSHLPYLQLLSGAKILCEKPMADMVKPLEAFKASGQNVFLVCNWLFLPSMKRKWYSNTIEYDYYNQGSEGFAYDMAQPLLLGNEESSFENSSPSFMLKVNGKKVTMEDVQRSYICMIRRWLNDEGGLWGIDEGIEMAKTIEKYQKEQTE